jgi:hypothetical protein
VYGFEQATELDDEGQGKLWLGRDRDYEIEAFGGVLFDGRPFLTGVRVPLGCELEISIVVFRSLGNTVIVR